MAFEQFNAEIFVGPAPENMGGGWYWSVSSSGGNRTESGTETTRLKAWRKACAVARRDFGPVS